MASEQPAPLRLAARGVSPVKGTRHLEVSHLDLRADGPTVDRRWCVVDVERRVVLRTVQNPELLRVVARLEDGLLSLSTDGQPPLSAAAPASDETLTCDYWGRATELRLCSGPHSAWLSRHLGRPVRLAAAAPGAVVYGAPITLVTTASLEALASRSGLADLAQEWTRFRPTLLLHTTTPDEELHWQGRELTVGSALLRVGDPVPRCAVIDHHPETGVRDARLLAQLPGPKPVFGAYATVERAGRV
ncbi:MOSC domain-containing protein [Nocardioides sp. Kera G14]|uniref:MOSC domain-containing protein n=1 Tax=Nocardioides sp. Kera G14 TaxID=2884264 RepID=UPI001D125B5C|nr:MOSC N-terminal beta barrel domain-containing protein [Nocardioides sp. Kera G14]UDY22774.1 MOSC N-terminal beta barrel domain-containing protein [Nocardioides sp. Kera G14]